MWDRGFPASGNPALAVIPEANRKRRHAVAVRPFDEGENRRGAEEGPFHQVAPRRRQELLGGHIPNDAHAAIELRLPLMYLSRLGLLPQTHQDLSVVAE